MRSIFLDAVVQAAAELGAAVQYHIGANVHVRLAMANGYSHPKLSGELVAILEYWLPTTSPSPKWLGINPDLVAQSASVLAP